MQGLFLPQPVVKHLKFKVGYLTVTFKRSFISKNIECVGKLLMLVREKRNLQQDLITIKAHTGPIEKKRKVSQQRLHEHYGQHSHNGIDDM